MGQALQMRPSNPRMQLAALRAAADTARYPSYAVELTWPERAEGVEDCRDERLEVHHAVGGRTDK